jgi:type VI secretion system secreted protein VgrG
MLKALQQAVYAALADSRAPAGSTSCASRKPMGWMQSLLTAASCMVGAANLNSARAGAGERKSAPGAGKLPHSADPIVAINERNADRYIHS